MGFKRQERNKGCFDGYNLQAAYNEAGKSINFSSSSSFVYPSIDPTAALIGSRRSFTTEIFNKEWSKTQNRKGNDFIEKLKQMGMIGSLPIQKINLDYQVISKWSHCAEMVILFEDTYEFMN